MLTYLTTTTLLLTTALAAPTTTTHLSERFTKSGRISTWADIPASASLHWVPCYGRFHCANLAVPLDYQDASAGTTTVAWIRQESQNATSKQDILFNPGGPGGSGIDFVLAGGGDSIIRSTGGRYNVVSFDPRGVNNSGVALTCFPGAPDTRDSVLTSLSGWASEAEKYAAAVAYGRWCTDVSKTNGSEIRYGGTVAVVQDMVHFTELQAVKDGKKKEDARIWFYGVSYGTVIGQTLAQLYPERLGRVIVDANVQGDDWYNGMTDTSVADADKGLENFFALCAEAGPSKCAYAGASKDSADIKKRFNALLDRLEKTPLQSVDFALGAPNIITKDSVLQWTFQGLYSPNVYFPYMARGFDFLEKNNATGWYTLLDSLAGEERPGPNNYTSTASMETLMMVTAIDAAGRYPIKNVDEYKKAVDAVEKTSVWFGENYGHTNALINAGMNIQPPKSQLFPSFKKVKTSVPVLFINTNADPITPLSSAKHMAQFYEGASVLVQNSGGHSFEGLASKCTLGHIATYLEKGTVPKDGTVCEAGWKPLVESKPSRKRDVVFDGDDVVFRW